MEIMQGSGDKAEGYILPRRTVLVHLRLSADQEAGKGYLDAGFKPTHHGLSTLRTIRHRLAIRN